MKLSKIDREMAVPSLKIQMARRDGNRVRGVFAERTRNLTPRGAEQAATVLFVPFLHDPGFTVQCAAILTESELWRAARILGQDARANFFQRRAFRRYCAAVALKSLQSLSEIAFSKSQKGRPYLTGMPQYSLSFSACRLGFLGAWSLTHRIGVDLEDMTRNLEAMELADRYFSDAEARAVRAATGQARLRSFYRFWTLKEASLKSIGEGLPFGLDAFDFELNPRTRLVSAPPAHGGRASFQAYEIDAARCSGTLVTQRGPVRSAPLPH